MSYRLRELTPVAHTQTRECDFSQSRTPREKLSMTSMRTPLISEVVSLHPPLTARKWTWLIDVVESEICRVFHVFPREGGSGSEGGRKKGRKVGAAGRLWKWGAALNFSSGFLELIRQPSKESRTGGQDEERRCSFASSLMKSDTPT